MLASRVIAADGVGIALLFSNAVHEPRAEPPASENVIHDQNRVIIGVGAGDARMADHDIGLGDFFIEVDLSGRSFGWVRPREIGQAGRFPVGKMRSEEGADPGLGDFSGNGDNSVIRPIIGSVKLLDIIRRNTCQRLGLARNQPSVGLLRVEVLPEGFAGNPAGVFFVAVQPALNLLADALKFVLRKARRQDDFGQEGKRPVQVLGQCRQADGRGIVAGVNR